LDSYNISLRNSSQIWKSQRTSTGFNRFSWTSSQPQLVQWS